jgi:purine nucleosidase
MLRKGIEDGAIIIGIGPLTNLSMVEQQHPGILEQARLFLMGGFIYPPRAGYPDWKNEFDFNVQVDVKSAKLVLSNLNPTTTLIPISVTAETALRRSSLERLRASGRLGELIAHQAEVFAQDEKMDAKYGATCANVPRDFVNFQHDPLACAIALGWDDGLVIEEVRIAVEERDGWLWERIDSAGRKMRVVTKVDGARFGEFWVELMTNR